MRMLYWSSSGSALFLKVWTLKEQVASRQGQYQDSAPTPKVWNLGGRMTFAKAASGS